MHSATFRYSPNSICRVAKSLLTYRSHQFATRHTIQPLNFSTTATRTMAQEYKLTGVTSLDLKPGFKQEVDVEGLDAKVLLVNAGGKVQAVGPKCTHYGAPLVKGILTTNGRLTCPWHGGKFQPNLPTPRIRIGNQVHLLIPPRLPCSLLQCQNGRC